MKLIPLIYNLADNPDNYQELYMWILDSDLPPWLVGEIVEGVLELIKEQDRPPIVLTEWDVLEEKFRLLY